MLVYESAEKNTDLAPLVDFTGWRQVGRVIQHQAAAAHGHLVLIEHVERLATFRPGAD